MEFSLNDFWATGLVFNLSFILNPGFVQAISGSFFLVFWLFQVSVFGFWSFRASITWVFRSVG